MKIPDISGLEISQIKINPTQILVVSSQSETRRALMAILNREGWDTICASKASECEELLARQNVNLVFCDRRLVDGTYRDVLTITRSLSRNARMVVTSRAADWDEYLEALQNGEFDLIESPCQPKDVIWAVVQAQHEPPPTH